MEKIKGIDFFSIDHSQIEEFAWFNGYYPNLENPKTHNERIFFSKYYEPVYKYNFSDKLYFKHYITKKFGNNFCCPVLYIGEDADYINKNFKGHYLKYTNGSGFNKQIDGSPIQFEKKDFATLWHEPCYIYNSNMYFVEEKFNIISDFGFYCFNGIAKMVQVDVGRCYTRPNMRSFYDKDFNNMHIKQNVDNITDVKKPAFYEEIKHIAEIIAKDSEQKFIRVDFMTNDTTYKIAEATYYPASGKRVFYPLAYNIFIGKLWD
jgi:hypothetical protein